MMHVCTSKVFGSDPNRARFQDFADNNIQGYGLSSLELETLRKLDLSRNEVKSLKPLARQLSRNLRGLEVLLLSGNRIGDDEYLELVKGLREHSSLRQLDLSQNKISSPKADDLVGLSNVTVR